MGIRSWYRRAVSYQQSAVSVSGRDPEGHPSLRRGTRTSTPTGHAGRSRTTPTHLTEAIPNPTTEDWFWGRASATGSEEDYFWRRLADNWSLKDVLPGTYLEIHNQVYEAYNANPMANAIIEMGTNFVLGEGLTISAPHPKVQKLIDAFWHDPDNRMDQRQYELATELSLYGELFVRFFVNPFDGHVKIALLDPSLVDQIECDPDNIEKQLRVHRRPLAASATAPLPPFGNDAAWSINNPNINNPQTPAQIGAQAGVPVVGPQGISNLGPRWSDGEWFTIPDQIMHFAVNKVSNAKRGKSDLATLLPWLRRYKDWLIDRVRINKYRAVYLWDVTLAGATRKDVESKMMEYTRPPEPGSILIHNESETWEAKQPNIAAADAAPDGLAIKLMIAMGAGIPEHWLSEAGDVNRATAAEMGLPTIKKFQRRQDYLTHLLRSILDRVIAEAQLAGSLPRTIDTSYAIRFPELDLEDIKGIGLAAYNMSQALATARALGLISQETAAQVFYDTCRQPQIDFGTEKEKLDAEGPMQPTLVPPPRITPAAPPNAAGPMQAPVGKPHPGAEGRPETGLAGTPSTRTSHGSETA